MIKKFHKMNTRQQIIFSIVIATGVVSFWRGMWGLMDEILIPENYFFSCLFSLIIGLAILIITGFATRELI